MKTFDQINDATGFANGEKWMTDEQIYDYFTTENMRRRRACGGVGGPGARHRAAAVGQWPAGGLGHPG